MGQKGFGSNWETIAVDKYNEVVKGEESKEDQQTKAYNEAVANGTAKPGPFDGINEAKKAAEDEALANAKAADDAFTNATNAISAPAGVPLTPPSSSVVPTVSTPGQWTVPTTSFDPAKVQLPGQGPVAATVALPTNFTGAQVALPNAPTAANIGFNTAAQYGQSGINAQNNLMQQLALQSQGQGPSVAGSMLKQGQDANLAAVMSQLASARGGANPLLQRTVAQTSAEINAKAAQDAATARLQEQLQAQGLLGQVSGQSAGQGLTQRGQDVGLATNQAGLTQQSILAGHSAGVQGSLANAEFIQDAAKTAYQGQLQGALTNAGFVQDVGMAQYDAARDAALANAGYAQDAAKTGFETQVAAARDQFMAEAEAGRLDAQMQGQYNELILKYQTLGLSAEQSKQQAAIDILRITTGVEMAATTADTAAREAEKERKNRLLGGILSGAATVLGSSLKEDAPSTPPEDNPYSDINLKTDISSGDAKLSSFLDALSASEYRYKDEKHGKGKFVSPMAQEIASTELGKSMVEQGEDGLRVNYGRAAGTMLSAQAMLFKRLKELEKKVH